MEGERDAGEGKLQEEAEAAELSDQDLENLTGGAGGAGGAGKGKAVPHDFTFTHLYDKAS